MTFTKKATKPKASFAHAHKKPQNNSKNSEQKTYKKPFHSKGDSFRSNKFKSKRPSSNSGHDGRGRGRNRSKFERIDVSKFINKAVPVEKEEKYVPKHNFIDFNIVPKLMKAIAERGYINPSPIQDKSIPETLKGHDILGIANTGTGKTAAFLIPLINKVILDISQPKSVDGPDHTGQVLIMAPTRELAIQIEKEFLAFIKGMKMYSVVCVGGAPIRPQIMEIKRGVDFIIGTPGRLMDLMKQGYLTVDHVHSVVLDEADRMLDMGFIDDMKRILSKVPADAQKLFFSATLAPEIENLVNTFLIKPVKVMVKTRDTSKNVEQNVVRVPRGASKIDALHDVLIAEGAKKVLIFVETKRGVDQLTEELNKRGFKAGSIHGDKRHRDRVRTLGLFTQEKLQILVATDVAARGLDIPDVTHVINYEIPQTYDTYVHRIGRTGRADKRGVALTFVPA
ncbi:MAG: DEAD/DEAH box helicase [Minisyncoccia bacterium]